MRFTLTLATIVGALTALPLEAQVAQRRLYLVPGVHFGMISGPTVAMTAFVDARSGVIGKGHIVSIAGGRDYFKAQYGIANVSNSPFGYSARLGAFLTRDRPLHAVPNSRYAGAEFHTYVAIVNLGAGFYAPVGDHKGRKGLLALSIGVGF